ncbi:MAG: mannose-1-phosphate guanylyltransferase [Candidatus Babeliales bacterium]|jgi:mannose-1-phosphate guanylyltransferase|nr:MAG: Mannose-1-phosphate guanylyltransferase (GDP) [candidate division TM6 bacterium GW2011_GWF2_36_6]
MNHFVILAGGSGQRLWPLSTKKCPKHLITFIDNKSLLEQTIERINWGNQKNPDHKIWVLTNQEQLELVKNHIQHLQVQNLDITVEAEPVARNTAPAILWMCEKIKKLDHDATIIILPADHFIPEKDIFNKTVEQAITFAQNNAKIVTLGVMPTMPATGYGYIQADTSVCQNIFPVIKFHEKPDLVKANQYINQPNMFWNAGIFVGKVSTFLNEFKTHSTQLFDNMQSYITGKKTYDSLENISIDYAIMEKSSNIYLIPAIFEWHDVGNLAVFLSLKKRFAKSIEDIINIDGYNNLSSTSKKVVVCIGVSDLCIVETDNIILVSKKDCTENVKNALPKVKQIYGMGL